MKIEGNTIIFKTVNEIYWKEQKGQKPNTARFLDTIDEIEQVVGFQAAFLESGNARIRIVNADQPQYSFTRKLNDITQYPGKWLYIFSWADEMI